MFCLTVAVGNIPWALMFKTEERATAVFETLQSESGTSVRVTDDFGQSLSLNTNFVGGYMLEDMDKSKLAHIERALHHARMQQEGQRLAAADATLRAGQHGPSIIAPMGGMNGGFPRQ